jgi:cell wall-associated NlpC family hydrolase
VPRDAHQQEAAAQPVAEPDLRPGDLLFYGEEGRADHVAFWLGAGRILHATGRDDVAAVVEESEPDLLRVGPRRGGRFTLW